ncbi:recombinase family protein [Streptomyces sp. BH105]|uniref:recombinase family protein n=1 Tax=Streptomyces sp. BH105 TaxID=3410408 RepID=UPI003CEC4539
MSNEKPRLAVYTRVANAGNPVALDAQQLRCVGWAASRGMQITEVYQSDGEHDRLLDLMNDISVGKFDAVVASEHNRYSRDAAKVEALTELARKQGTAVHVVKWEDLDLTKPAGKMTLDMMGCFEDLEREQARAAAKVRRSREGGS